MFTRLTYLKPVPNRLDEVKKIFNDQIVPVVRSQKGNLGIRLLEPVEKSDDFISITEWENEAVAKTYDTSGKYKELVGKISDLLAKEPVLKQYRVQEIMTRATR